MLRRIQGVVLGFLVNVAIGMTSVVLAYSLLGPERVFRPGLYESSGLWIAIGIVLAIVAGWASGWVAARVGGWKAVVMSSTTKTVFMSPVAGSNLMPATLPMPMSAE